MSSLRVLYIALLILIISCKDNSNKTSMKGESTSIQNLRGREVPTDSINLFIERKMLEMDIPGVSFAIINNGKVVFHKVMGYSNKRGHELVNDKTLFEGASTSKPVFASMVMLLVEDGKLELDTPLYNYLKEDARNNFDYDERYQNITARMALSHTTGFPNWREKGKLTIAFDPGTNFSYSGEGYQFLVKAVESILRTDHQGLENYFQRRIARPLGMAHTKFVQDEYNRNHKAHPHFNGTENDRNNWTAREFSAASGLHTESLEFSKWLIAIMDDRLLTKHSSDRLLTDQITASKAPALIAEEGAVAWTLGFAKYTILDHVVLGHEGNNDGFNALFLFDKEKKWGMVQFNNANEVYDFGFDLFSYINEN